MIRYFERLVRPLPGLLAVALVCLLPSLVRAENVVFRNECKASVVVQTATVVKGVVKRDQPTLLRMGECTPKIPLDVDRIVTVYDARSNRVLYRDVIKASKKEVGAGISFDPQTNKVRLVARKPSMLKPAEKMSND
jgi:hypothetical protein